MSLKQRTLRGLLWTGGGKGAHAVLQVGVLAILARLLSPADFGTVGAAMVVISFSTIFSTIGLGPALVQRLDLEPRHQQTAFAASTLLGLALGSLLWLGAPAVAGFYQMPAVAPVLRALALAFPLRGLAVVAEAGLQRALRFRWLATIEVLSYALGYGLGGVGGALLGWGVWALVTAAIAQTAVRTALLLASQPPPGRVRLETRALTELAYFGGGFTLARVFNTLALQADHLVVGRWLGPAALGLYGRAYALVAMPASLLGHVLDTVLFPTIARIQDDALRLTAAYRRGVALIALVTLPASVVLVVLAPEIVHVVLGPRWAKAVPPLQIFAVGLLFRTSYKLSDSLSRATGTVYRRAWRQAVYAALALGGAWVAQASGGGITGVAVAVLGAVVVNYVLMAELGLSVTELTWLGYWRAHRPALWLGAITGVVVWGVATLLRTWSWPPFPLLATASAAVLVAILVVIRTARARFLGPDGLWMLDLAKTLVPAASLRWRTPHQPTGSPARLSDHVSTPAAAR